MTSEEFRNHCRAVAQAQLAVILTEMQGMSGHPLRFDVLEVHELRCALAEAFDVFTGTTPVEKVDDVTRSLINPGAHSIASRRYHIDAERERLAKAGLSLGGEQVNGRESA